MWGVWCQHPGRALGIWYEMGGKPAVMTRTDALRVAGELNEYDSTGWSYEPRELHPSVTPSKPERGA